MAEYLGLAIGLAEFAFGIASHIQEIHRSYKSADKTLTSVYNECCMFRDAIGTLQIRGQEAVENQTETKSPVEMLLEECKTILTNLNAEINKIKQHQGGWKRLRFLFNEPRLKELLQDLRNQRNMLGWIWIRISSRMRRYFEDPKLAVTTSTQMRGPSPSRPNRPETERRSTEAIAKGILGKRTFMKPPLSQEGLVIAVSDSEHRYEQADRVYSTVHTSAESHLWVTTSKRVQNVCAKRYGISTGEIEVLLHVRPEIALNSQKDGTLLGGDSAAYPTVWGEAGFGMPIDWVMERHTPLLLAEFPKHTKVFSLCSVLDAFKTTLSITLRHYPWDPRYNERFKQLAAGKTYTTYYPMTEVAEMIGVSLYALSKLTSSVLIVSPENKKVNIGLNLKYERKRLKVIRYSRKIPELEDWELSERLSGSSQFPDIFVFADKEREGMASASEFFPGSDSAKKMKMVMRWLKSKKSPATKTVDGLPRRAVIRPRDASFRLQYQDFALGDRIALVKDTEDFRRPIEGVVVRLNPNSVDAIWDTPNKYGTTLGGRCSPQRGSTVGFSSCLNLANPQFIYPAPASSSKEK
ncbi:hypothetical protein BD779DRAFT_1747205 [Infundibulicybe gibba]|nr:hypothetical protein BD779DRAFT_1747205 [Infundibulicybe gibba]